ncbi:serine/threonine-protein kinase WNK8-like [Sesamum indicum]|uniref:non-specific serine/threonine protein kinase n=1 Tax=Sesamum indicum TaxID=4182 RepID=A0A6I9T7U3_SESIN|nr:serine/threonine-protein kinase WNK8-like [Sesamum indicum]
MDSQGFQKSDFRETDIAERSPCCSYARYKKILGRGAFKDVYKGFDHVNNMEIAWNQICVDDESTLKSPGNQVSLCSEAVLLNSLNHRNIMKCYSYWVDYDNKSVNIITELFSSGSLRQYMKKLGGVDIQTIKNWGRQMLQGLEYLHSRNPCIIHRDVKCDNIFVDASKGEIKLGDFGLATAMEQSPVRVLAGTPEFMAPEYYDEEYNELVDVYAFGMCLMELATSEYPYSECTNPAQIFKKVTSGIKPAALGKVQDPQVKEIIERCFLPASLRPSAVELLKDPFFSFEIRTEIEHNSRCPSSTTSSRDSSLTVAEIDESRAVSSSSLEVDFGVDSTDRLVRNEDQYLGVESCYINESGFSEIYAMYNSISLSDATSGKLPTSCCQSSVGDVSMNSKITFASSSGAASKDFLFCISRLSLPRKSQLT